MNFYMGMILLIVGMLMGASAHEGDIQRKCKKDGRSGYATWHGEIECSPVSIEK